MQSVDNILCTLINTTHFFSKKLFLVPNAILETPMPLHLNPLCIKCSPLDSRFQPSLPSSPHHTAHEKFVCIYLFLSHTDNATCQKHTASDQTSREGEINSYMDYIQKKIILITPDTYL